MISLEIQELQHKQTALEEIITKRSTFLKRPIQAPPMNTSLDRRNRVRPRKIPVTIRKD